MAKINNKIYKDRHSLVFMNKTRDGRFIDKRVSINSDLLKQIIIKTKENKKLTWKEFGLKLGVSEQTVRHDWINKGNTIPFSIFHKIIKMSNEKFNILNKIKVKEPFWGQKLKNGLIKTKKIKFPDINTEEFAEFYGIMLGDGCVFSNMYGLAISADKILEHNYFNKYIKNLIYTLFGVYPSFYYSKKVRSMNCFLYSKLAAEFMAEVGFPIGKKNKGRLVIPNFIFKDNTRLAKCMRGLMDTDGSLSSHPNSKIMIHLSIPNKDLRSSVMKGLKQLNINGGEFNKGIMIYGRDKIKDFYKKIGFSNKKNIIKYEKFIETAKVPSTKEVEIFIREIKSI